MTFYKPRFEMPFLYGFPKI